MNLGIYARKSVFSDNSDSINNQQRMCRDYVAMSTTIENEYVYEDESYTGANTQRPALKRMMSDVEDGLLDMVIVYQLDRLSRDVRDFSNIYAFLQEHNVQFVSVVEHIDTTTPVGEAMMYISAAFAQMERKSIANRVNDNMIGLAKEGYWFGGNPPLGYRRERIEGNGKKHTIIVLVEEDAEYVHWLFDTFLENKFSLQGMVTYLKHRNVLTRNGKFFATTQLHSMLTMPQCVENDGYMYDYYAAMGCQMAQPRELWDGKHGIIIYGRTSERSNKHVKNPPEKWIVCVGKHEPFMASEKWLRVQRQFTHNIFDKTMKYDVPLLKGVLRCGCGCLMSVSRKKKLQGVSSWYYCSKRTKQGKEYCPQGHIKIDVLDGKVLELFKQIEGSPSSIRKYVKTEKKDVSRHKTILSQIGGTENKIQTLTNNLSTNNNSTASKYIIAEIEKLDASLSSLRKELVKADAAKRKYKNTEQLVKEKTDQITHLMKHIDTIPPEEQNEIAKTVLKRCVWENNELFIEF